MHAPGLGALGQGCPAWPPRRGSSVSSVHGPAGCSNDTSGHRSRLTLSQVLSAQSPSEQHLSLFIDEETEAASWQVAELEFVPRWPGSKPVLLTSALLTLASLVPAVPSHEELHVIRFIAITRGCLSIRWQWCFELAFALTPAPVCPLCASRPSMWWKGASWSPSTTLWLRRRASSPSCQR